MKNIGRNSIALFLLILLQAFAVDASSMRLTKYVPRNTYIVIGADFDPLRANDVYAEMERKGQIWQQQEDSDLRHYMQLLRINPASDLHTLLLAKYVNSYGNKGRIYLLELTRSIKPQLENKTPTEYLGMPMFRINNNEDGYVAEIVPDTIVLGSLNEVKQAVDVSRAKSPALSQNVEIQKLLGNVPQTAAVWGAAVPLSRKEAAALGVDQSTNAVLQAFENYYFFGIPKKKTADSFFIGQASGEKEAAFVNTFMIGTLAFAKLRVDDSVADLLDQIQVERKGNKIQVSAVVTKEMVDAYLNGDFGVD